MIAIGCLFLVGVTYRVVIEINVAYQNKAVGKSTHLTFLVPDSNAHKGHLLVCRQFEFHVTCIEVEFSVNQAGVSNIQSPRLFKQLYNAVGLANI